MALKTDAMLGVAMRFHVVVDGIDLGGWASCKGLTVTFNPEKITEGGNYEHEIFLAGQVKYEPITLERAITSEDAGKVMTWLAKKIDDYSGGTAQVTLFDSKGGQVTSWSLRNVFPARWSGPSLNAKAAEVALETLELVHEGFV